MKYQAIETEDAPGAIGPYSQAVVAEPWVLVSGQIGLVPETGELVGTEFSAQARQALKNLTAILTAAGCELGDVVSVDVFVTDMERFADFNRIYAEFFGDHKPARAVIGVWALPKAASVELRCMAKRPGS